MFLSSRRRAGHLLPFPPWSMLAILWVICLGVSNAEWLQRSVSPIDQSYTAVTWPDDGVVIAVSAKASGTILRSTDYGVSWTLVATSLSTSSMYGVASKTISTTSYTYTVDDLGYIYKSLDQGVTWSNPAQLLSGSYCVAIGSNGNIFLGGTAAVQKSTTSTDSSWTRKTLSGTSVGALYGLATIDGLGVISVSSGGRIHYTLNGGSSWSMSTAIYTAALVAKSTAGGSLYCVSMGNTTIAYAAGASGIMFKTATAGVSWYTLTSPLSGTDIMYQALSALDANTVYVAGTNGNLFASFNGGISWTQQFSVGTTTTTGLTSVSMYSTTRGVAGGSSGFGVYALVPSKFASTSFICSCSVRLTLCCDFF